MGGWVGYKTFFSKTKKRSSVKMIHYKAPSCSLNVVMMTSQALMILLCLCFYVNRSFGLKIPLGDSQERALTRQDVRRNMILICHI